jgi:FKBP-type peptidyl-prolyl cis-trans isomerase
VNHIARFTSGLIAYAGSISIANAADTPVKKSKKPKVLETDLGIKYIELIKGTGAYPNPGDFVVISYT